MLTPYLNPRSQAEERYNTSHIKTRNSVERQYGVMKRRFPALAIGLRIKLETAVNVIVACCILHNICIEFRVAIPPTPDEVDENHLNILIEQGQIQNNISTSTHVIQNAVDRRNIITHNFFAI